MTYRWTSIPALWKRVMNKKLQVQMKRQFFFAAMVLTAVLFIQSCSSNGILKGRKQQLKPAPAIEGQKSVVTGTGEQMPNGLKNTNPASAAAPIPVKKRTPAELIAALPCKLQGVTGVFIVFPDNPAAGQACFSVYPAPGNGLEITQFDIQGGGMHVVFHYTEGGEPGSVKLMRWDERDGNPCLEAACGTEIPVKRETYSDPGESSWSYTIITPEKPLNFVNLSEEYIGLVMGAEKYTPLFH
jgi:hypothetical protein